jgi:glycosyltransferase involved in cell wall biosynthesis
MAVHYGMSIADEWATGKQIRPDGMAYRSIRRQEEEVLTHLDGIVYVSSATRDEVLARQPKAASVPSAVIHNFASDGPVSKDTSLLGDLVSVGRLAPTKNQQFLLAVVATAKRLGRDLTLDLFGEGPDSDSLHVLADRLGIADQVRFWGFRSDVREFLPRYRAYVHAATFEPCSIAVLEAMAAGLPVVAGDVGGMSELCQEGVEARFWDLNDPEGSASVLLGLLGSETQRARAGVSARSRFERDFSEAVVAPRLCSFVVGDLACP